MMNIIKKGIVVFLGISLIVIAGVFWKNLGNEKVGALRIFTVEQGGTGAATLTGCLEGNGTAAITGTGSPCGTGAGGGGGGGSWSTTTSSVAGQLINYPNNTSDIVAIGSNATTSAEFYYDPNSFFLFVKSASSTVAGPLDVIGNFRLPLLSQGFAYIGSGGKVNSLASSSIDLSWLGGQITDSQIADGAVDGGTGGEIADASITSADLGTDSVSADELNATGVESELEAVLDLQDLQGAVTDSQVPNTITVDLASAATALASNGSNCSAGSFPLGVDASGAVESCTDAWTEAENTSAAYTPQARTLTVAGTANQITSSAGAQNLSANRTWTLSIPSQFNIQQASTTVFSADSICLTGDLPCKTTWPTGGGGASDFTFLTNFGTVSAATNTPLWLQSPLYSSSTIAFNHNVITEDGDQFFNIQRNVTNGDYTLIQCKGPRTSNGRPSAECTMSLFLDMDGNDAGTNFEFVDIYNEHYSDSQQWGLRQAYKGTGGAKPFVIGTWNQPGGGAAKDPGNKFIILPNGTVAAAISTSTIDQSAQFYVASSTATNLLMIDDAPGSNKLSVSGTGFGTTTVTGLNVNGSATSTSNVGFNITAGCYAIGGTCLSTSGGAGSSSVGPVNTLQASNGSGGFIATGTPNLTVGYLTATSSTYSHINNGGLIVGGTGQETYQLTSVGTNNTTSIGDLGILGTVQLGTTDNNTIGYQHGQANTSGLVQTVAGWDFIGNSHTVGAQSASIAFTTRNAGSFGERMRISFNGNVGIGSTTPWKQLSVGSSNTGTFAISTSTNGCAQFTKGELWITGSACGTSVGLSSYDAWTHPSAGESATTSAITVTSTTTTNALQVGSTAIGSNVAKFSPLTGLTTSNSESVGGVVNENYGTTDALNHAIYSNNTGSQRVLSIISDSDTYSGNTVHIRNDGTNSALNILCQPTGKGCLKIGAQGVGDANAALISLDASLAGFLGQTFFFTCGTNPTCWNMRDLNNSQVLTASKDAYFGWGTTTPAWQVQIATSSRPQFVLTDPNAGTNLKHWTQRSVGGNFYISTSSDVYATSSVAALTIDSNAKVTVTNLLTSVLTIGAETITNFTNSVRALFTGGDGITITAGDIDCDTADTNTFGCLTDTDWDTFNNKQNTVTAGDNLTKTGDDIDLDATLTGLTGITSTGLLDFGGGVLEIPNGTGPTADDPGEIAHDTSGNQLIMDDFVVGQSENIIWSRTIASTSPAFLSGGLMPLPTRLDGFTITRIQCHVVTATSKVIAIEDASGNSSEDITCATTNTTDDGSITNATYTASELAYIDFGAGSGSPDYVSITVYGTWTRE